MLRDYFRAFWRGVLHHKAATFINVAGLALGLAVFIALTFYVKREFSWDAHWEGADSIFRAAASQEGPNGNTPAIMTNAPYVLGNSLRGLDPAAFEVMTRVYQNQFTIEAGGEDYPNRSIHYSEPSLLDLLQLETLAGSLQEVFADPRSVAIHQRDAEQIFGERSPLGETITARPQQGGEIDFVIKAVFNVPEPSSLSGTRFLALLDPAALPQQNVALDLWNFPQRLQPPKPDDPPQIIPFQVTHYFKLAEGVDANALEGDLRALMDQNKYMEFGTNKTRFQFQNLQEVHLMPGPFDAGDNVQRLWIYAAIGVLVLAISGCNFVMLATLRLVDRMREVGIRKTVGGAAGQLMQQHLLDAFCHTLVAATLAVALLAVSLPIMEKQLQFSLGISVLSPQSLGAILLIVVAFTLFSSAYPAWMISRGKPALLLRNNSGSVVSGGNSLRKALVGIQFAIVVVLLLATAVVQQQIEYTRTRDRGYKLDNVVAARVSDFQQMSKTPALVTEINKLPGVEAAAVGTVSPGSVMLSNPTIYRVLAEDGSTRQGGLQSVSSGAGYFGVMSVAVLAGREFTAEQEGTMPAPIPDPNAPPIVTNALLNVSAARVLGFANPEEAVGQLLETDNSAPQGPRTQQRRVIGVIADTQFSSAMLPPVPQIYGYSAQNGFFAVKLEAGADVESVKEAIKAVWESVITGSVFTPFDPVQSMAFEMRREEFEAKIVTGSTLLAIVIALLGLYGLVAATVIKRVKEIGVRKVMGAERSNIVVLFLWQFSKPIMVANLVAWPLGFWAMTQWLQRFPYQLDTLFIVLSGIAASVLALFIAWLTVGLMAAKAAAANPVMALRYE